jgi:hypothetical protein
MKSTEMRGKKKVEGSYDDDIDNDNDKNKMEEIINVQIYNGT